MFYTAIFWFATTLAHEIGEYVRAYNYDKQKQFVDTVINYLFEINAISTEQDIMAYYYAYHAGDASTTIQDAKEELVNVVTAQLFFAEGGIEQLVEHIAGKEDISVKEKKTFLETLKEIINKIVDVIKKYVTNNNLSASEKAVADMSLDDVKKLRAQFLDVIDGAIANLENGVEIGKSIKYSLSDNAKDDVKRALTDFSYRNDVKLTDNTPSIIISQKGTKNLPMVMKPSHIRENVFTKEEAKNKGLSVNDKINYHGLGEQLFLDVINDLEDVTVAYRGTKNAEMPSRRENYFILISEHKDNDGNNINVPVYIDEQSNVNRVFIETNKIATVFGKSNLYKWLQNQVNRGNLIRIKNKSIKVSEHSGTSPEGYNNNASNNSISKNTPNVKYSLDVDSVEQEYEDAQKQTISLRNKISALKSSNEYHQMVSNISSSYGVALDTALSEYGKWLNTSGLNDAIRALDEVEKRNKQLRQKLADMKNGVDTPKSFEDLSDKEIAKYISKAENHFGITDNYKLAGYLTVNGKMLDFSEGQKRRTQDHREIRDVLDFIGDDSNFSDGMITFMNMGNIRLQEYGIDISKAPNEKQIAVLKDMFSKLNGEIKVDFSNENGNNIDSVEYVRGTSAERIIHDIESFYKNGALSKPSAVSQFHTKYSIDVDSESNRLSEQQQEYFKNSKARDENGNLLVLYHQTGADFTVFNTDNQKAGKYDSEMPTGVFLKPTKNDIGLSGKKQMEVYANMVNPLVVSSRSDAKRYFEENISGYREALKRISDIDKEYQKKYDEADIRDDEIYKQLFQDFKDKKITSQEFKQGIEETETKRILNEWTNESDNARLEAKLLIDSYFADSEYDSMIVKNDAGSFGRTVTSYIAFNSNQIKNVDNTNPTDNVDIRYSVDVETEDVKSLIKQNKKLQKTVEYYKMMLGRNSGHKVNRKRIRQYAVELTI